MPARRGWTRAPLRSLSPVLGRQEGEERKGRTGHTADNEPGRRGLTAGAATPRGAKFVIGETGLPHGLLSSRCHRRLPRGVPPCRRGAVERLALQRGVWSKVLQETPPGRPTCCILTLGSFAGSCGGRAQTGSTILTSVSALLSCTRPGRSGQRSTRRARERPNKELKLTKPGKLRSFAA